MQGDTADTVRMKRHSRLLVARLMARLVIWGGISRNGVMASARRLRAAPLPSMAVRFAFVVPASALIGTGVAFLLSADLGVPPYDVLLSAIDQHTALSHGQAAWTMSAIILSAAALFGVRPKPVGIAYVFLTGIAVDLARPIVVGSEAFGVRVAMAALGTSLLAAGIGTIVHTSATGGSFEAVMEVAERRGRSAAAARTMMELSVLLGGILAGGQFGAMTVVLALVLGPTIKLTLQAMDDHRRGRTARLDEKQTLPVAAR